MLLRALSRNYQLLGRCSSTAVSSARRNDSLPPVSQLNLNRFSSIENVVDESDTFGNYPERKKSSESTDRSQSNKKSKSKNKVKKKGKKQNKEKINIKIPTEMNNKSINTINLWKNLTSIDINNEKITVSIVNYFYFLLYSYHITEY